MSNSPFKNVNNLLVSHEDASYLPLLLQIRVVHNALTSLVMDCCIFLSSPSDFFTFNKDIGISALKFMLI